MSNFIRNSSRFRRSIQFLLVAAILLVILTPFLFISSDLLSTKEWSATITALAISLSILGIAVTVAGFALAWVQLNRTAEASVAANLATSKALAEVRNKSTMIIATECVGDIKQIRIALSEEQFQIAFHHLDLFNKKALELHGAFPGQSAALERFRKELRQVAIQVLNLQKGKGKKLNHYKINKLLAAIDDEIALISHSLKPQYAHTETRDE